LSEAHILCFLSRMSTFIADLPPETLNEITRRLKARYIVRLLKCGSKLMNEKLMNHGGVQEFRLKSRDEDSFVWPSFIQQFSKLRVLSLIHDGFISENGLTTEMLLSLPVGLNTLELGCDSSFSKFRSVFTSNSEFLPHLTSLYLHGDDEDTEPVILSWPKNLTYLDFWSSRSHDLDLASLPENLTYLDGWFHKIKDTQLKFPASLTYIDISMKANCDWIPTLPSGLIHCFIYIGDEDTITTIPNTSLLPSNLTFLNMHIVHIDRKFIEHLPRSLTHLQLRSENCFSEDNLAYLPPNLRRLESLPDPIMPNIAKLLPRSLTMVSQNVHISALPDMPLNFEKLRLSWTNELELEAALNAFPPSLKKIPMPLNSIHLFQFNPRLVSLLPSTLDTLYVEKTSFDEDSMKALPQNLQRIATSYLTPGFHAERLQLFPRNLTDMDISSLSLDQTPYPLPEESSKWLPRGLLSLSIGPTILQSNSWFEHLPETLVDIVIKSANSTISWEIKMPPALTDFNIFFRDSLPREHLKNFLHSITRTLRRVDISHVECNLQDEDFENFPVVPELRSLGLPACPHLTGNIKEKLPLLTVFLIDGKEPEWMEPKRELYRSHTSRFIPLR
jgi:hypothetical protein